MWHAVEWEELRLVASDADHLRIAAAQLANSAVALTGQVSAIDSVPLRSSALISWASGCSVAESRRTEMNTARGEVI